MPASDNGSYFSRFVLKFLEIVAAGLATAVSGYLIAHLSGVLSTPVPAPAAAVIQVPPNGSKVSAQPNGQSLAPGASTGSGPSAVATGPAATDARSDPAIPPISVNANDQRRAPAHEVNTPAVTPPGRKAVNITKPESSRNVSESAANAAASPRQHGSFVSRVRAALTNIDANRPEPPEVSVHQSDRPPASAAQPQPIPDSLPLAPSIAAQPPRSVTDSNLPATVEIKSRPVAEAPSSPPPAADKEPGALSTLEQMLRQDPLAGTNDAPRPPLPVGQ